jgi:anti-sigma regulatory factor (Ser/Thr protein kinase)
MEVTVSAIARDPISVAVVEPSQVGEARRAAATLSEALGFDDTARGEVAIAVTELATNLVRHAKSGEIVLRSLPSISGGGLEVLALDRGPGITNLAEALRDGYTTGSTPGTGLGAVERLATTFAVHSSPRSGTALLAQFRPAELESAAPGPAPLQFGWVCLPMRGEDANGDACWVEHLDGGRTMILLADGLGHGLQAAEASRQAVRLFRQNATLDGPKLLGLLHAGLRSTRGAAVAVADVRHGQHEVRFTGVGNIGGTLITGGATRSMVSQNGTVGAEARRIQEFTYPFADDTLLVMYSDGLASRWQLGQYPGLQLKHPSLIAGVLYRDHRRERDDVTVLVAVNGQKQA